MVRSSISRFAMHCLLMMTLVGSLLVFVAGPVALPVYADSTICAVPGGDGPQTRLSGVINTYYPGEATVSVGATTITLGAARGASIAIAPGDLVVVIQMQDAAIDFSNTSAYGDGTPGAPARGATDLNNAGRYEYAVATSATPLGGGPLTLRGDGPGGGLVYAYTNAGPTAAQGQRRFQVVRVPQYSRVTLDAANPLTAAPWDGRSGGILALDVAGDLDLSGATMNVAGQGFRGGGGIRQQGRGLDASQIGTGEDYVNISANNFHGSKGEGIAGTPRLLYNALTDTVFDTGSDGYPGGSEARGAPGNAGGGATDGNPVNNQQNAGGGGGGNGGNGGNGGRTWSTSLDRGGHGGTFSPTPDRLVMGGGGGAGTTNDGSRDPGLSNSGVASSGAPGGGMVMVRAGTVTGSGVVNASGATGPTPGRDGAGGGGAGGSVLFMSAAGSLAGLQINAAGGRGSDSWPSQPPGTVDEFAVSDSNARHGPGGGGGGGVVYVSDAAVATSANVAGGPNGIATNARSPFGAAPGSDGISLAITPSDLPTIISGAECLPRLETVKATSTPFRVNTPTGTTANYTIRVSNAPDLGTALNVNISDTLPPGFTLNQTNAITLTGGAIRTATVNPTAGATALTWGVFDLPGGAQIEIDFTVDIAPGVTGTFDNPATATYLDPQRDIPGGTTDAPYDEINNDDEDVTVVLAPPQADLAIDKLSNGPFEVGGNGVYTLRVTNNGPDPAQGPITVTDDLPGSLSYVSATGAGWTCSFAAPRVTCEHPGPLNPGASLPDITLTVQVLVSAAPSVTNSATVSSPTDDPDPDNNTDRVTTPVQTPDISATKRDELVVDNNGNGQANPGDVLEYTIIITNSGSATARDVVFSDTPDPKTVLQAGSVQLTPAGAGVITRGNTPGDTSIEVQLGDLASSSSVTIRFRVQIIDPLVLPPGVTETVVANQGFITGSNFDQTPTDDPDTSRPDDPTETGVSLFVTLLSFTATRHDGAIQVRWVTAMEQNTWGFHIYRSSDGSRVNAVRVTPRLIRSQGRGEVGATYTWTDRDVASGMRYTYWLQETELDGTLHEYGPATLIFWTSADSQVFLPIITR